jgi:hypothetical protein
VRSSVGDRVRLRRPDRCADDADAGVGEDRVEGGREQLSTRVNMRYASRMAKAGDHAARAVDGAYKVGRVAANPLPRGRDTVLGTHRFTPCTTVGTAADVVGAERIT